MPGRPIVFAGYQTTPGDSPDLGYTPGDDCDPAVMPLLDGGDRTGIGLRLHNVACIEVRNLQVTQYEVGVETGNADHVVLDNIIGIRFGGTGSYEGKSFRLDACTDCIIRNCVAADGRAENFCLGGSGNLMEQCYSYGIEGTTHAESTDYYMFVRGTHNTVRDCHVHRTRDLPHNGHGLEVIGGSYNRFEDCTATNIIEGMVVKYGHHNEFVNCTATA